MLWSNVVHTVTWVPQQHLLNRNQFTESHLRLFNTGDTWSYFLVLLTLHARTTMLNTLICDFLSSIRSNGELRKSNLRFNYEISFELWMEAILMLMIFAVILSCMSSSEWKISTIYGLIIDPHNNKSPVGLLAQVIEHCTCMAQVRIRVPFRQLWIFQTFHSPLLSLNKSIA